MATFEVASTMAAHADRMVASQELEPGHGWDYRSLEAAYRGASPDELGSAIIDGFNNQALASGTENDITLSMIDLENFGIVDDAYLDADAADGEGMTFDIKGGITGGLTVDVVAGPDTLGFKGGLLMEIKRND
jgi:hypothetical protein